MIPHENFSLSDIQTETWMDIIGFEGLYQTSSFGRIKSLSRITEYRHLQRIEKEKIKSVSITFGYAITRLNNKKIKKVFGIGRLVAIHFLPNPFNYKQVNHIDGNKLNNHFLNLEWCTPSQNVLHAYKMGLKKSIGKEIWSKNLKSIENKPVQCLCTGRILLRKQACKELNISNPYFSKMIAGSRPNWTNFISI